jgi:diacylglycerol kinase (ATP)
MPKFARSLTLSYTKKRTNIITHNMDREEMQTQIRKALIVHSPHSGRANELGQALIDLQQEGISIVEMLAIGDLDDLPAQGKRWVASGIETVIAAGGDGLVGGVITHIAESDLQLGILPLGTANDIARSLHIPQDIRLAAKTIAHGQAKAIDIGVAQPAEQTPHPAIASQEKPSHTYTSPQAHGYFAHALTVGLNVQFARLATNIATRQRYGGFTYPLAALEVLKNRAVLDVELHFEGLVMRPSMPAELQTVSTSEVTSLCCRALQVTAINAPIFGGAWQLTIPGASLQDSLLDILVIEDIDREALSTAISRFFHYQAQRPSDLDLWLARYTHLATAELTSIPGIHHLRTRGVTISTMNDPQDATLDGEIRDQTPIYAHMAKKPVRIIAPP